MTAGVRKLGLTLHVVASVSWLGAVLGLGMGGWVPARGPEGMWAGLTAGLMVAAILLSLRFRRSAARVPLSPRRAEAE